MSCPNWQRYGLHVNTKDIRFWLLPCFFFRFGDGRNYLSLQCSFYSWLFALGNLRNPNPTLTLTLTLSLSLSFSLSLSLSLSLSEPVLTFAYLNIKITPPRAYYFHSESLAVNNWRSRMTGMVESKWRYWIHLPNYSIGL